MQILTITLLLSSVLSISFVTSQLVRLPIEKQRKLQTKTNFQGSVIDLIRETGELPVKTFNDNAYTCPVKIGSTNQTFDLQIDTGSYYLWIPHPSMKETAKTTYNCSASKTCVSYESKGNTTINYVIGQTIGYEIQDHLNFGNLILPNFSMILAQEVVDTDLQTLDGIMGLSLSQPKEIKYKNILSTMRESGLINSSTFSIYMGSDVEENGRETGEIIFGGYDPKYAISEFQFVSIKPESNFWEADGIALGFGTEVNLTQNSISVTFDTGATLVVFPKWLQTELINKIKSKGIDCIPSRDNPGLYDCDCRVEKELPDLIIYFKNLSLNISRSTYVYKKLQTCTLGIQSVSSNATHGYEIILGDVFLKNYYALYSADNFTIGFAKALPTPALPFAYEIPLVLILICFSIGLCCWKSWHKRFSTITERHSLRAQGSLGAYRSASEQL